MKPTDFRFHHRLHVRWAEVNRQGIVFIPHYLTYYDCAITGYWRALALPYQAAMQRLEGDIFLRKTAVEFDGSARLDDRLDIGLRCDRIGNSSMRFVGAIFHGEQLLNAGELVYVFADPATRTSCPVPAPLRALLEAYEAGHPVTWTQVGDWAALREPASAVRTAVFIEEQGIAREDEWDEADHAAVHAVVSNLLGMPVATGRLLQDAPRVGRIGRMAVLQPLRGSGLGQAVIESLERAARARGDHELRLSAQRSAEGFYRRLGYQPHGAPYEEVGIPHIGMRRALA